MWGDSNIPPLTKIMSATNPFEMNVYQGEAPLPDLKVTKGDAFCLAFNLYDFDGVALADGELCNFYIGMSSKDDYSGTGNYLYHFSGTVASGTASVEVTATATALVGDYWGQVKVRSTTVEAGHMTSDVTFGTFRFMVGEYGDDD